MNTSDFLVSSSTTPASLMDHLNIRDSTSPAFSKLKSLLKSNDSLRFTINIDDIRRRDQALATSIIQNPADYFKDLESSLFTMIQDQSELRAIYDHRFLFNPSSDLSNVSTAPSTSSSPLLPLETFKKAVRREPLKISLSFQGSLGAFELRPGTLHSEFQNRLVKLVGLVTRVGPVRPSIRKALHYCRNTDTFLEKAYSDITDLGVIPSSVGYLNKDEEGNALTTEFGLCHFENTQLLTLQDLPEHKDIEKLQGSEGSSNGNLTGSVNVLLSGDLVNHWKPGDRLAVYGVLRMIGGKVGSNIRAVSKCLFIANNICSLPNAGTLSTERVSLSNSRIIRGLQTHSKYEETVEEIRTLLNHVAAKVILKNRLGERSLSYSLESDPLGTELPEGSENVLAASVTDSLVEGFCSTNEGDLSRVESFFCSGKSSSALLTLLAESAFPHIHGHLPVKKALILQMLGGLEVTKPIHVRGDIHILLLGDPSTAKSQFLRSMLSLAPVAVSASGRGSSGVGLTAAITNTSNGPLGAEAGELVEKTLEAGAMVRADRGVICIDEFDKMTDGDRVSLHEVMEQQTVTVAKSGVHCTLNARCSMLAAANPIFGCYDTQKSPQENVALPDSLLSRFDLLFVFLDEPDTHKDFEKAMHVLSNRMQKSDGSLSHDFNENSGEVLKVGVVKDILMVAKALSKPLLSEKARELVESAYVDLRRREDKDFVVPITPRTLEGLIRLSTAVAKLKLQTAVMEADVKEAINLLYYSLGIKGLEETELRKGEDEERKRTAWSKEDENDYERFKGVMSEVFEDVDEIDKKGLKSYLVKIKNLSIDEESLMHYLEKMSEEQLIIMSDNKKMIYKI